jgi:hypothetical protein
MIVNFYEVTDNVQICGYVAMQIDVRMTRECVCFTRCDTDETTETRFWFNLLKIR